MGLGVLVGPKLARSAALADQHGLPVEVAGDPSPLEGLAAVSGLASQVAHQARQLLPLGEVSQVSLLDTRGQVVLCRLFTCTGDAMAIATFGNAAPPRSAMDQAVMAVLGTIGFDPDEAPTLVRSNA